MVKTLVKSTKYNGKYVALKSFDSHEVIGSGVTPQEAHEQARQKGCDSPVITYIPAEGITQIY